MVRTGPPRCPCEVSTCQGVPELWTATDRSRRQQEPSGEAIEACPAIHLALEHLQVVDLAFEGALTPGQGHGGVDGGHVRPEPFGEAPEGREGARGGTSQPWVEPCRLAPADQAGNVLRQRHSSRQWRSVRRELLQSLVVRLRAPVWRAEDQPRRMPRGQRAV
jgi:hypothetical protein